jgi:hypothetical protein
MVPSANLREQAERCRRLARDCIDPGVRDGLLKLADEYAAQAAEEGTGPADGASNDPDAS